MSIIYCELHGLNWDSDKRSECPACENEHAEDEEAETDMTNSELRQELLKLADWIKSLPRPAYWPEWDLAQYFMLCLAAERIPEDGDKLESPAICKAMIRFWEKRLKVIAARPEEK